MKNTLSKSSLNKTEIDTKCVDFDTLEKEFRRSVKSNLLNISFFAKSDMAALACEKKLGSDSIQIYNFFSFQDALRTGFLSYVDIIVLADDFHESSHIKFEQLVQSRLKRRVEIISWDKIDFDKLIDSILNSIENIKKSKTSHFFVSRLVGYEGKKVFSSNRLEVTCKNEMDETYFENLLQKEFSSIPSSQPEALLKKGIEIIKEFKK